jgi:ABC-type lipoprotein release transport system permease subunit
LGIRIALGATAQAVRREVIYSGILRAFTGLAVGVGLAFVSWRAAAARVPGLERLDPVDVLIVAASVLALTVLTTWLPAQRAARTDPLGVLRAD